MKAGIDDIENKLEVKGINSQGFGTISKLVMRDRNLTPEAKAIYAYICSYAGAGCTAFPSVSLILADLGMSRPRYYKHRKLLEERGYITVFQGERQGSRYAHNTYRINQYMEISEGNGCVKALEKKDGETLVDEHDVEPVGEECGKPGNPQVNEESQFLTPEKTEEDNSQMSGWSSFVAIENETLQNMAPNTNRFEKSTCNTSSLLHPPNQKEPPCSLERGEEGAFKRLCASSIQRNLLGNNEGVALTRNAYGRLLEEKQRYTPEEIQAAWARRQSMAHEEKKKTCHYPQLRKWLESEAVDGARAMMEEDRQKEQKEKKKAYRSAVSELCDRDPEFAAMHAEASAAERAAETGGLTRQEADAAWQPIDALITSFLATRGA